MMDKKYIPNYAINFSRKKLEDLCNILQDCMPEDAVVEAIKLIKELNLIRAKKRVISLEKRLKKIKAESGIDG